MVSRPLRSRVHRQVAAADGGTAQEAQRVGPTRATPRGRSFLRYAAGGVGRLPSFRCTARTHLGRPSDEPLLTSRVSGRPTSTGERPVRRHRASVAIIQGCGEALRGRCANDADEGSQLR